jgi:hypothetical protein
MTLPKKEEKSYLEIQETSKGFIVTARNEDAAALAALFLQYGISCERKADKGKITFQFPKAIQRGQIESVVEGYKTAKGS